MNEAIKLAIEKGGYVTGFVHDRLAEIDPLGVPEIYICDSNFWQALGKALGWGNDLWVGEMNRLVGDKLAKVKWEVPDWQHHAQIYFDLVLTGGDTEKFWRDLLKQNQNAPTKESRA